MLANPDYGGVDGRSAGHTSDEGHQLQLSLEHAGWTLAGAGFADGCRDVTELLRRYAPRAVVVADKRDWSPDCEGSYRKDIGFANLAALKAAPGVFRACVLKDAGSMKEYHRAFFAETAADAAVVYYHPAIVRSLNPWLGLTKIVRTYHTVDRRLCDSILFRVERKRAIVTGATSSVYPLRTQVMLAATKDPRLGIDVVGHPGYSNRGHHTPGYLHMIGNYRVHVATASIFGFALRKIIESVAMGCTPVTNLPAHDVLPKIDGALVRVHPKAPVHEVLEAVAAADRAWDRDERIAWAERARGWYDWRAAGLRLHEAIATEMAQPA